VTDPTVTTTAFDPATIGYLSEIVPQYAGDIRSAADVGLDALRERLAYWAPICPDALAACPSPDEFAEFASGLEAETGKRFAGEQWAERYGPIVMPETLVVVSEYAARFQVPWGLMYIRMRDEGWLPVGSSTAPNQQPTQTTGDQINQKGAGG